LIDEDGKNLGIFKFDEIFKIAEERNTGLILISEKANPPVVRLGDYYKYLYKLKKQSKKEKKSELKEIRVSFQEAEGDLIRKAKQIEEFYQNVSKYFQLAKKKKVRLQLLVTRGKEVIKGPTDDIIEDNFSSKFLCAPCYEPWYNLIIDPLGNVGPCITSASFASKSLNVTKMSLKEIWYGREFDEIRKKRLNKIPLPQCSHCTVTEMRKQIRSQLIDYLKKINELDKFR